MARSINYKENLFERANLTPIHGKQTFKTLHKLRNEIKANAKSVYSNIGGGAHVHLGLVLTDAQCALISPTPFSLTDTPGSSYHYGRHNHPCKLQHTYQAHRGSVPVA